MKQKVVLKVDLHDERMKKKAMKIASGLSGVEVVSVDMKDKRMIILGDIDPVSVVSKLRKWCHTEIVRVGPAEVDLKVKPATAAKEDKIKIHRSPKVTVPDLNLISDGYPLYNQMQHVPLKLSEYSYPLYNNQMIPPHYSDQHYYGTYKFRRGS